jgi:hypothetical protein
MTCNHNDSGSNELLLYIFQTVFSLCQRYGDTVPTQALQEMDLANDCSSGVAAEVLKRLKREPRLREQLSTY